jgi:DNA polymerase I
VTLNLIDDESLEPFSWTDSNFIPYYLSAEDASGEKVTKLDLFTQNKRVCYKVSIAGTKKNLVGWESEIDPALSYTYDRGLRFGVLHRFENGAWLPQASLDSEQSSSFDDLFGEIEERDPLKYALVKQAYSWTDLPVPRISRKKLGLPDDDGSDEDYYNAILLSRLANLPITRTYRNHTVSTWIRSMLNTYYRAHNILIPNSDELKLGDTRRSATGALTIAPESGTYFNMHVLDFESLYPGCIDVFNLSYETIRCPHPECRQNLVPGLDYHVCKKRRGVYSALTGALRDLRLKVFKPRAKDTLDKNAIAASQILKLFLVSCYGVTIRIHGLASPLLAEAITAYGRHVLQTTWDMAKEMGLGPRYGDTDSVFLDNPRKEEVGRYIESVKERFSLELAYDRVYSVCVLSAAKKAYFGILPNGEPEIKGLSIAKSNSPRFFQQTFQKCLAKLAEGRRSRHDFELAKQQVPAVVEEAIRELRYGKIRLSDLEYQVELRDDPQEKLKSGRLPQPYQAAWLMLKEGKKIRAGEALTFVKVHPFGFQGRRLTVKPSSQANIREINVDDYVRNLYSSLSQTFQPMAINLQKTVTGLSEFT